jgi:hypothetical protein
VPAPGPSAGWEREVCRRFPLRALRGRFPVSFNSWMNFFWSSGLSLARRRTPALVRPVTRERIMFLASWPQFSTIWSTASANLPSRLECWGDSRLPRESSAYEMASASPCPYLCLFLVRYGARFPFSSPQTEA